MHPITFFVAILPFLPALNIIEGFDISLVRVLALGWFSIWFIKRALRRETIFPSSAAPVAISALVFLALLSGIWAIAPEFALRKAFYLATLLPIAWVGATLTPKEKEAALRGLRIGATAAATFALVVFSGQFIFGPAIIEKGIIALAPFFFGSEAAGAVTAFPSWYVAINNGDILRSFLPFPNPHTAVLFWGFGLATTLAYRNIGQSFILGAALLTTFSRGGFVVLGVTLIAWMFLRRKEEREIRREMGGRRIKNTVRIFIGVVFVALLVPEIIERASAIFIAGEGSISGRLLLWKDAIFVGRTAPIFGVGIGGLAAALDPLAGYRIPTNAHSMYLEFFSELGLIGVGLFLWALMAALKGFFRRQKQRFGQAGLLCLVVYIVHAVFETNIYSPVNLFILMLLIGMSVSWREEQTT